MASTGQLFLIRHGRTEWSAAGRHTGRTDLDLTAAGLAEVELLGAAFSRRPFASVRCSPLLRARRTAELLELPGVVIDDDLAEWDYGAYEGLTTAEISESTGGDWSIWRDGVVPGDTPGETLDHVSERIDRVLQRVHAALDEGDVALVAHGHSLRVLAARWLGEPADKGAMFRLETATFSVLGHEHGRPVVLRWSVRG